MGTLKNGILGGFSGRLGNVVVYEMHGKTVVRSLPSVKQKKATGKRKQYQDDFRYVMKWMQVLKPMIDKCWLVESPQKSSFKQAFSFNLKRYREVERPETYEWLQVSQGTYPGLEDLSFTALENRFRISWQIPKRYTDTHAKDPIYIYFVDLAHQQANEIIYITERGAGDIEVELKNWTALDPILAFMVVMPNNNIGKSSETMCCSLIPIIDHLE